MIRCLSLSPGATADRALFAAAPGDGNREGRRNGDEKAGVAERFRVPTPHIRVQALAPPRSAAQRRQGLRPHVPLAGEVATSPRTTPFTPSCSCRPGRVRSRPRSSSTSSRAMRSSLAGRRCGWHKTASRGWSSTWPTTARGGRAGSPVRLLSTDIPRDDRRGPADGTGHPLCRGVAGEPAGIRPRKARSCRHEPRKSGRRARRRQRTPHQERLPDAGRRRARGRVLRPPAGQAVSADWSNCSAERRR